MSGPLGQTLLSARVSRPRPRLGLVVLFLFPSSFFLSSSEDFPFVLPWDDASPGVTNVAAWQARPAGRDGFVRVEDGHLYAGAGRIRFLGVNLCFGANFPAHADADKIAPRLARFGINCVRFHHMDTGPAPGGIFQPDLRTLDPAQLDKLDYLIARLKENGIYADLNLHVSRTYPVLVKGAAGVPTYGKGVDLFAPALIELQKEYARDLLTHFNPYTRTRYAEEPAVAFVEINNENGLLREWFGRGLDNLPRELAAELARQWNEWLKARYREDGALRRAWTQGAEPLGAEQLKNADFAQGAANWNLEQHQGAQAAAAVAAGPGGKRALRISVRETSAEGWHVQLTQTGLACRKGRACSVSFQARADAPRRISVTLMQAHEPWRSLASAEARLTTEWQTFRFVLAPSEDEPDGRITFSDLAAAKGDVWLAALSLRPGGVLGSAPDEPLGRVSILRRGDFAGRTLCAQRDWIRFLWETEERYWTGMYRYLKEELKVRALVIGTQMGYSPAPIQAQLDVVDVHGYWQHPRFPRKPWDREDWTVRNVSMAGAPDGGTLAGMALTRVAGKPFVCTEYNHAAPNTYSGEAFLLLAACAALQDWDGIFAFSYCHRRDDWDARRICGFFDIDQHPVKMATLPAAAALFRRGDLQAPANARIVSVSAEQALEHVRLSGPTLRGSAFGLTNLDIFRRPVALRLEPGGGAAATVRVREPAEQFVTSDNGQLVWDARQRVVTIAAPRSAAVIGAARKDAAFKLGDTVVTFGATSQEWAALALTVMEGRDFASAGRWLITAAGAAGNTDMVWKSAEKDSVGAAWGKAPSLVEGIPAAIRLAAPPGKVRAWALDERGRRRAELRVSAEQGRARLELDPAQRTLWYEVERQ